MLVSALVFVEGAILVYLARLFWPLPFTRDFLLLSSRSLIAGLSPIRAYARPSVVLVLAATLGLLLLPLAHAASFAPAVLSGLLLGCAGSGSPPQPVDRAPLFAIPANAALVPSRTGLPPLRALAPSRDRGHKVP